MRKISCLLLSFLAVCLAGCDGNVLDLSGEWRFATDPDDVGVREAWWGTTLADHVTLPGSMLTNGKGNAVDLNTPWTGGTGDRSLWRDSAYAPYRAADNFKIPCWLQPDLYYRGVAWYQRDFEVPQGVEDSYVRLFLERVHWHSTVWVDDVLVGRGDALSAPHVFDLTGRLTPGRHTLTVRVDNDVHDVNPGLDSHSVSDHTQGNWNGIVGRMALEVKPETAVTHVDVYPSAEQQKVDVVAEVWAAAECDETIALRVGKDSRKVSCHLAKGMNTVKGTVEMSSRVKEWDEFTPSLYKLQYALAGSRDKGEVTFGFRRLTGEGGVLCLNGHPAFMRGTLHCGTFPFTGYPATDKEEWLRELKICKAYGLNHIRFHSWCPPAAAFEAADELGMYFQIECSAWCNTLGSGGPTDDFLIEESKRIVREFGNHPSFCFMAYGNEPGGPDYVNYLKRFTAYWTKTDPRRLYVCSSGWPNIPESDYYDDPAPRIQSWGGGLKSIINAQAPSTAYDWLSYTSRFADKPMISHEIGQWCVYPNFHEIEKYTGVYKARNFEIFQDFLTNHGMAELADDFLYASGRLQTLCYKADIEAALRTKNFGGFQLLGINDFSGQGTALVGALDAFWDDKGYTDAAEYRRFCNSFVPLARMDKLIFLSDEPFKAGIELANYKEPMTGKTVRWNLHDKAGKTVQEGTFDLPSIPMGNCLKAGDVQCDLSAIATPAALELEVAVDDYVNSWNVWVYPSQKQPECGSVLMTDELSDSVLQQLEEGASVLLSIRKGKLSRAAGGNIKVGFSSIFWNTAWTNKQPPHTLGILCDPAHPALAGFPTESYSDFQWQDAMSHAQAVRLDIFETPLTPVVRIIDDWFTARPLAMFLECRVGRGKLLVSGVDFFDDMDSRVAGRQLLGSLLDYMNSDGFDPAATLTERDVATLVQCHSGMKPFTFSEKETAGALAIIVPGGKLEEYGNNDYSPATDATCLSDGYSYAVDCKGDWLDDTGTYWYGYDMALHIRVPGRSAMRLKVTFGDPNEADRSGSLVCEGKPAVLLGEHVMEKTVSFDITPADCRDGVITLETHCTSGPNLMIKKVVLEKVG